MSTEDSRAVVEGIYSAVNGGGTRAFMDALHPELRVSSAPYLPHGGPDQTFDEWQQMLASLTVLDINGLVVEQVVADGPYVSATARVGLKDSEETVLFCENWEIRDGKAYRMRVYCYDPAPLLAALQAAESAPVA